MSVKRYDVSDWSVLLELSTTSPSVVRRAVLGALLSAHPELPVEISDVSDLLEQRDAEGSTEIDQGVWLPHAVIPGWGEVFTVLARAPDEEGDYRAWIYLFVGVGAAPADRELVTSFVQLCAQPEFLAAVRQDPTPAVHDLITKKTAQLSRYLGTDLSPTTTGGAMTTLNELLLPGAVQLHGTPADWREAITIAGTLLAERDAITGAYTEEMIQNVDTNGPYIVVAPGFAFAHARPSAAVKKTAISWVHLERPVEFGHSKNDPVSLVVALAAQDSSAHTAAMKELATLLADRDRRAAVEAAQDEAELRAALLGPSHAPAPQETVAAPDEPRAKSTDADAVPSKNKILTVCGNGLGTSLFLKNSLGHVLDEWGWSQYVDVEATDTISAKGRAKEADFLLTSGEIAATLGDVGVPVYVIEDFTNLGEIDSALRELYAI